MDHTGPEEGSICWSSHVAPRRCVLSTSTLAKHCDVQRTTSGGFDSPLGDVTRGQRQRKGILPHRTTVWAAWRLLSSGNLRRNRATPIRWVQMQTKSVRVHCGVSSPPLPPSPGHLPRDLGLMEGSRFVQTPWCKPPLESPCLVYPLTSVRNQYFLSDD